MLNKKNKTLAAQNCNLLSFSIFSVATPIKMRGIYNIWLEVKNNSGEVIVKKLNGMIENRLKLILGNEEIQKLRRIKSKIATCWNKSWRNKKRFEEVYHDWLETELFFFFCEKELCLVCVFFKYFIYLCSYFNNNNLLTIWK